MKLECTELEQDYFQISRYLKYKAVTNKVPYKATFELTPRCNFNCKMCYIHLDEKQIRSQGKELTVDQWLHIAREGKKLGLLYLTLTGGEIFTYPEFKKLYIELCKLGFLITLMTNASLINEEVIKWLKEYPPYSISITLYGSNNTVYHNVCGIENGFDRVAHAIELLREIGIPFRVKTLVIKENSYDLKNIKEFAKRHNIVLRYSYGVVKPVGGAISNAEQSRINIYDVPMDVLVEDKSSSYKGPNNGPYKHHLLYAEDCSNYACAYKISWTGFMKLCSFMNYPKINVLDTDVETAWKNLLKELKSLKKPDDCINCQYEQYCLRCPGVLYSEAGTHDKVTEEFCQRAKYLYRAFNSGGVLND